MLGDINDNEKQRSVCESGRFKNPWPTWTKPSFGNLFRFVFVDENKRNIPSAAVCAPNRKYYVLSSNANLIFHIHSIGTRQDVANYNTKIGLIATN